MPKSAAKPGQSLGRPIHCAFLILSTSYKPKPTAVMHPPTIPMRGAQSLSIAAPRRDKRDNDYKCDQCGERSGANLLLRDVVEKAEDYRGKGDGED